MSALSVQPTFPIFTDIDGQPLDNGYIWIGIANTAPIGNPINVYWDAALTIPAVQPIRTIGGYPANNGTPARLYVNSDYSIQVQNKNGSVLYSAPAATERISGDVITGLIEYTPGPDSLFTATTVQEALDDVSDRVEGSSVVGYMPGGVSGTAQAGAGSTITLASGASAENDAYKDMVVQITSGVGVGQYRTITGYVGSTKVATVSPAWGVTPDNTSVYNIAVPTTVQAKLRETVSVKDFGAVGDGVTDDTAAIQAALFSGSKVIRIPTGAYLITSKLFIPAQSALIGDTTGIGGDGARGSTLLADDTLTDFILENYSITAAPSDPWWHGGRIEYVQFRAKTPGLRTASGFNAGPCGDNSTIRNCKFFGFAVGLNIGGTGANQGVQVSCNIDTVSFYQCNTGLLFDRGRFTAGVRNIMLDTCTIPVHFKDCGSTFHCNIDQWHAEGMNSATEIFYIDNCDNSYHEIRAGSVEASGASATLSVVRVTRTTASNKARVKVANAFSTNNSNYILNDVDLGVSWTQAELGLSYGEINHNFNTVLNSGQGFQIFGKSYSGVWTPVVSDAASGGNAGTATVIGARFQRIGNMVFVQGNLTSIDTTGMTAGNALFIQGLPFAANGSFNRQVGSAVASNIAAGSIYACTVVAGASAIRLTKTANADALVSDVTSGSGLAYFNIAYTV